VFRVPYAPAIVDLDEGYQMVTNLVGLRPDAITPDLPVQVEFHHTGGGLHLPYFRPRAAEDSRERTRRLDRARKAAMHIALRMNLYRAATLTVPVSLVQAAEDLGYHSVWSAEAYGADALSPLAYLAGFTRRIKLGTARRPAGGPPPATLAMHALTIDALAGGVRVIIGVGVSGPQIVEGWYGQPWGHPAERLRDYVAILRKVLDRDAPVTHDGPEISLPYSRTRVERAGQAAAPRSCMPPRPSPCGWRQAGPGTPSCVPRRRTGGCRWPSDRTLTWRRWNVGGRRGEVGRPASRCSPDCRSGSPTTSRGRWTGCVR